MKVLLICKARTPVPQTTMWEALGGLCELDRVEFGEAEMEQYAVALARQPFARYDRVLLDQNIRRIARQYPALRSVPNLVFLEQDACQEFIPDSPWRGRYAAVFRDVGRLRVLVCNRTCERAFQGAGLDCGYLPKAVDERVIANLQQPRDIEFGHIGRIKHAAYSGRRGLLESVQAPLGLQVLRTEYGDRGAYNVMLNRIRFFVSADVGMNEYMFKNFEAMAAGCVLIAKRQPAMEQEALGFEDMRHLVLYDDARELLAKAERLRREPELGAQIAAAGQALVRERHQMGRRAGELYQLLQPPIREARPLSFGEKVRHLWSRPFWR
jgi:glycosyltransferase involved in cell wall biosynthesis